MNVISSYPKKAMCWLLATIAVCCSLPSCNAIYDDEGDCSVTYRLAFCYDKNMKWADAFAHEVKSVHLYAFDKDGALVWQQSERGEDLAANGNAMPLDLPAGDYRLVAWCGLENDGAHEESFSVPEAHVGETTLEQLQCSLSRARNAAGAYSDQKLYALFHGMLDVSLPANDNGGSYTYTMKLTKDTNHIRVILQQLSGKPVNVSDFTFRIEEENGLMGYDNKLLPDEMITYLPHDTVTGTAGLGIDDYPTIVKSGMPAAKASSVITSVSVAIADFTIARLIEDRHTFLIIETKEGKLVANVPVVDFALLLMDGYDREMDKQDYLDRQDEYALTFFLDERGKWIETSIIINSWKVVLNKVHF